MSRERIIYQEVSLLWRLLALIIDVVIVGILVLVFIEAFMMEYDLLWKKIFPLEKEIINLIPIIAFVDLFPLYWIGFHLINGRTLGKILCGIYVLTEDDQPTDFKHQGYLNSLFIHTKRFILLKRGTKVVREYDPPVPELM